MDYEFIGKAVWIKKEKILVISDLHLGYEEMLNEQGVLVPRFQYKETISDLEKIFKKLGKEKIKEIIILGDLKHEFGKISVQEWKDVFGILEFLEKKGGKIVVLKGTHDTILEPILRKFPEVVFKDIYFKGYFAFYHGDKKIKLDKELKINKKIKTIMKGHLHPAVVLKKGAKSETYKCFLVGKEKGKRVIILPSFLTLNIGSDISGFKEYKEFNCYIVGEKVYNFGKLKEIGKLV